MARAGGLGVIHRFMPAERMAAELKRVKRAESYIVEKPATVAPTVTVGAAREALESQGIGGLLVADDDGELLGLLTTRDVLLAPDPLATVDTVMTPRAKIVTVTAPGRADLETARRLLHEYRIEKLPLVDAHGHIVGLITAQDIIKIQEHPATKDAKGRRAWARRSACAPISTGRRRASRRARTRSWWTSRTGTRITRSTWCAN
jgi:IMP dehydrogenase